MKKTSKDKQKINIDADLIQLIKEEECMTRVLARIQTDLNEFENSTERLSYLKCWVDLAQLIELIKPVVMGMYDQQIKTILNDTYQKKNVEERLYPINEVAQKLGCSRSTVYNKHLKEGLKSLDFGERHQKVKASDLQHYIDKVENRKRLSN